LEFSTVEESEQGSSATASLSEDVTDVGKEEGRRKKEEGKRKKEKGRRKKEESFLKFAMANYQCPMLFGPITNYQFSIPKTNRARTARPIY
jgi:hypothetical protein